MTAGVAVSIGLGRFYCLVFTKRIFPIVKCAFKNYIRDVFHIHLTARFLCIDNISDYLSEIIFVSILRGVFGCVA